MSKNCSTCNESKPSEEFRLVKENRTKVESSYLCSICRVCERKRALERYYTNRDRNIENNKIYKKQNREKVNSTRREYTKDLMKDPLEKIKRNLKSMISAKLKNHKKHSSSYYLGTSMETIISWIEYNMDEDMTWDNYGKLWHIDHTIPIKLIALDTDMCFSWMNLMPLPSHINLKKSHRLVPYRVFYQETRLRKFITEKPGLEEEVLTYISAYSKKFKLLLHKID